MYIMSCVADIGGRKVNGRLEIQFYSFLGVYRTPLLDWEERVFCSAGGLFICFQCPLLRNEFLRCGRCGGLLGEALRKSCVVVWMRIIVGILA